MAPAPRAHPFVGLFWVLVVVVAVAVEPRVAAAVLGVTAGIAAREVASVAAGSGGVAGEVHLAVPVAAVMPWAAWEASAAAGAVLVAGAVASVIHAAVAHGDRVWARAGATVQAWLLVGLAAAGPMFAARLELGAVVVLMGVASCFDAGDHLVGADARSSWAGPLAGVVAVAAAVFTASAVGVPPFDVASAPAFGVLAALGAVTGPLIGALVAPAGRGLGAVAVRRLDVLLVLGPAWPLAVGWYLGEL